MLDATPRFLLEFLPGRNWVLAVKNRYELIRFEGEEGSPTALHTMLVRPGLTYFHLVDREPVFNLSVQYATYLSLGFGERPWYRHGPYLGFLYHLSEGVQLNTAFGVQWVCWTESSEFDRVWPNNGYAEQIYRPFTIDVGLIITVDPSR